MPKSIANAPEVAPENEYFYIAFHELSTCRLVEGGHIPWTAISAYSEANTIDDDQAEMLLDVVRKLDLWFLDFMAKRQAKKDKKPKGKASLKPK